MIVLIDIEEKTVTVCDKKVTQYSLGDISGISEAISGKEVYYVTSADLVSGDQVVGLLSQFAGVSPPPPKKVSNIKYLHTVGMSNIILAGEEHTFVLHGAGDCRRMDSIPPDILESDNLRKYMEMNMVEVIDEDRRIEVMKEVRSKQKKLEELRERDSSILTSDSSSGSAEKRASEGIMEGEDIADELLIDTNEQFDRDSEQETYKNIKELGLELD